MAVNILDTSGGMLTASITGSITPADLETLQQSAGEWLKTNDQGTILILGEQFTGFKSGNWTNLSFQLKFDKQIRKIAVVCEGQWADQIMMFMGKGLRQVGIEHFEPAEVDKALKWLRQT